MPPPHPVKKWFAYKSVQATFAAFNAWVLYKIDPQIDVKKQYFDSMGKDDPVHSFLRLVMLHYSADLRKEIACTDPEKKCMRPVKRIIAFYVFVDDGRSISSVFKNIATDQPKCKNFVDSPYSPCLEFLDLLGIVSRIHHLKLDLSVVQFSSALCVLDEGERLFTADVMLEMLDCHRDANNSIGLPMLY